MERTEETCWESLGPGECLGPGPAQDAQSISVLFIYFFNVKE